MSRQQADSGQREVLRQLGRHLYGVDLGEAKRIVHYSGAWTDMREPAERLFDDMLRTALDEGWTVTEEPEQRVPATAA